MAKRHISVIPLKGVGTFPASAYLPDELKKIFKMLFFVLFMLI
jgi:hypothetical protein